LVVKIKLTNQKHYYKGKPLKVNKIPQTKINQPKDNGKNVFQPRAIN
jgi:hypothetical protein